MSDGSIGLGVIGCGGFGLFALQQFAQIPGIRLAGMAGTARPAAQAAARRFGLKDIVEVEQLVALPEVDLVYIATPPFLHFEQARLALSAGKHVISEKPLAMTVDEADELVALSKKNDLLLIANLMQRYNPLFEKVQQLVEGRMLGEPLHGFFENYASDENLPAEHWFWDRAKSGGIFVEHGVHFFDLFAGWLGAGEVVSADVSRRNDTGLEDQALCAVRYPQGVVVNFYHGFHQPGRLDRQEFRLVFERGDMTLYDWVPTRIHIRGVADEDSMRQLCELIPAARIDVIAGYGGNDRHCRGHGKELDIYQNFEMDWSDGRGKMPLYCELLRSMMADQLAWIGNRKHARRITEANGRDSVAMACAANAMAVGSPWSVVRSP